MSVQDRNNVRVVGEGPGTLLLAHGFGCDQTMWSALLPALTPHWRVVLFDYVGCGGSDFGAFDPARYGTLQGWTQDLLDVAQALALRDAVLVGHSVSAMTAVLAARQAPQCFSHLVLIGPSPRYLNDPPAYTGGFERADIEGLLELMDTNYAAWAGFLAQAVAGPAAPSGLAQDLERSFCAMDPEAARCFAQATFYADNRADLAGVRQPALILQCRDDAIAPDAVGEFVHRQMPGSTLARLQATGHCPHVSHPEETLAVLGPWLVRQGLPGVG